MTGEQSKVVGKIASDLRLHAQFAQSGVSEAGGRAHSQPSAGRNRRRRRQPARR